MGVGFRGNRWNLPPPSQRVGEVFVLLYVVLLGAVMAQKVVSFDCIRLVSVSCICR